MSLVFIKVLSLLYFTELLHKPTVAHWTYYKTPSNITATHRAFIQVSSTVHTKLSGDHEAVALHNVKVTINVAIIDRIFEQGDIPWEQFMRLLH